MKKKIYTFILCSLAVLCVGPAINLYFILVDNAKLPHNLKGWKSALFNMDFILSQAGRTLYSVGISVNPEKVIVGKSGWLFLGDSYAKSITVKRNGPREIDKKTAKTIAHAAAAWNAWFLEHGVREYRIIIGPDKDSVYPEYLPGWAAHSPWSLTDQLMETADSRIFLYPRDQLIAAKKVFNSPVYYKTDTHWNLVGGGIAFKQLAENLSKSQPGLTWPKEISPSDVSLVSRAGGDLSNFQRIGDAVRDDDIRLKPFEESPVSVEQTEFLTGKDVKPGSFGDVRILTTATLVRSTNALNNKKVLWLRDSFGSALAPFMAATFTETLQLHHNRAKPQLIAEIVAKFKPDYIIVTNVERDSREGFLTSTPPD